MPEAAVSGSIGIGDLCVCYSSCGPQKRGCTVGHQKRRHGRRASGGGVGRRLRGRSVCVCVSVCGLQKRGRMVEWSASVAASWAACLWHGQLACLCAGWGLRRCRRAAARAASATAAFASCLRRQGRAVDRLALAVAWVDFPFGD